MNVLSAYLKKMERMLLAAVTLCCLFASCDSVIYDDEGDCSVTYRLKFRYDLNLKWADAFAHEVSSVHLYAFDKTGVLVWQQEEKMNPQTADDYSMLLDLPAGDYQLLAWCGLKNDGEREESFTVPEARVGETRIEQLQCGLTRWYDQEGAYSDKRLYPLFHGRLDVTLPTNNDGGDYTYTMSLTKNTNHVRIILQHLSGVDVDVNKFTFRIEDKNGLMAYDNQLQPDETIHYRPWKTQSAEAGVGSEDTRSIVYVKSAIADLTVGRMTVAHRKNMILTITNNGNGKVVARIPLIDYALLSKDYYEEEYNCRMDDQEFLDREDDYVLTFFLDEDNYWLNAYILINSWRVVLQDVDLQ